MQGVCVDAGGSTNLTVGRSYYLFEHSAGHYYASRFNTPRSFFGIYRKMLFSEVKEVAEPLHNNVSPSNEKLAKKEPVKKVTYKKYPHLQPYGIYSARLITDKYEKLSPPRLYGQTFYLRIRPSQTFTLYFPNPMMDGYGGCIPLEQFTDFEPHDPKKVVPKEKPPEKWQQMSLF